MLAQYENGVLVMRRAAFSLVELSIVLVILGLLVGGILAGQSLIRAAELRSITTQFTQYVTAVQGFRNKYMGLPGDLKNATKFWGEQDPVASTCRTTPSTGILTCDGDGDGRVWDAGTSEWYELLRFWQHLSNAGLIEGRYTGAGVTTSYEHLCGTNAPRGRIANSCWEARYLGNVSGSSSHPDGETGHTMFLGGPWATQQPLDAIITPEELWNIDTKMDDGKPVTGNVVSPKNGWNAPSGTLVCTTSNAVATAQYNLTNGTKQCFPIFRNVF